MVLRGVKLTVVAKPKSLAWQTLCVQTDPTQIHLTAVAHTLFPLQNQLPSHPLKSIAIPNSTANLTLCLTVGNVLVPTKTT